MSAEIIPKSIIDAGRRALSTGAVRRFHRDGDRCESEVEPFGESLHRCALTLEEGDQGFCDATCSCDGVGRDRVCHHLVATFLHAVAVPTAAPVQREPQALTAAVPTARRPRHLWGRALPRDATSHELLYVFDAGAVARAAPAMVTIHAHDGSRPVAWRRVRRLEVDSKTDFPLHADRNLYWMLMGADAGTLQNSFGRPTARSRFQLRPDAVDAALQALAETGRLFARHGQETSEEPIGFSSDARRVRILIEKASEGWHPRVELVGEDDAIDAAECTDLFESGIYLAGGVIGRFGPTTAGTAIRHVLEFRPRYQAQRRVMAWLESLQSHLVGVELVLPPSWSVVEADEPRAILRVDRLESPGRSRSRRIRASLLVEYGTKEPHYVCQSGIGSFDHGKRRFVRRDAAFELQITQRLLAAGASPSEEASYDVDIPLDGFAELVASLASAGWIVEVDGARQRGRPAVKLSVTSGQDWFDLSGELDYGDDAVASLPDVLRALRRKSSVVRLSDGSEGELPAAWLARFARLVGLGESHETGIRFGNHQALWLDLLLEEAGSAVADTTFRGVVERLRQLGEPREVREPKAFRGDLRAYQRIGLSWMNRLHEAGLGGCLADDMGLGKTIQVLAFLLRHRRTLGKCAALVVCPRSVVGNWLTEASRFAPTLRVVDASVPDRDLAALDRAHLAVTTYGIVRRDIATLKDCEFSFVILDEAQMIKNASSLTAKATRLLRAPQRFALSGTPIENHLGDLWSQMEFLNPGLLGRARGFQAALKAKDGLEYADVARAVAPFVLRRTKERVATELPPKVEQTITCKLDKAQRRIYDELAAYYRLSLRKRVAEEGAETARMHVLEALLRLRQAACHPALIDPDSKVGSAKFELVLERLPEIVETGHKVLVFSQFTTLLGLLRVEIEAAGIGLAYLDGRTRKRDAEIERFQNDPACSVFLISLKAGGTGLNLTAADYVFVLDPWWNPAAESQAIDRAHRIGQSRSVLAYRLIAEDTIEQKIQALQEEKRALAAAVIKSDASALPGLSVEALLDLLG